MEEEKQKVYVVMGNDFPEAVFASKEDADAYVTKKKVERNERGYSRVYWRHYEFDLIGREV